MTEYRGQYGIVKHPASLPKGFQAKTLGSEYSLLYHSELPVAIKAVGARLAVLVGHAVDWRHPEWTNEDVLSYLLAEPSPGGVAQRSSSLAGRWALAVLCEDPFALNDACGTMGVVHHQDGIASSARLLSDILGGLPRSELITPDFELRQASRFHSGQPIPGRSTEYVGCRTLLANHWLNLRSGVPVRFHPTQPYPRRPLGEIAPSVARVLEGIVKGIARRGKIAVGVTAGFDSRALVAAVSRVPGLVPETLFYTFQDEYACPAGHYDLRGAERITKAVGGVHHVVPVAPPPAKTNRVEHMVAPRFESWAERCRLEPFRDRIVLSGWASETGRAFIRWPGSENPDVEQIMGCLGARDQSQFLEDIGSWQKDAITVRDRFNLPVMDLFYWELTGSTWIKSGLNILNSGSDWLTIYSCRELLDLMLSVREADRGGRRQRLYRAVIRELNPLLLDVPFNPLRPRERLRRFIKTDVRGFAIRVADATGSREFIRSRLRKR